MRWIFLRASQITLGFLLAFAFGEITARYTPLLPHRYFVTKAVNGICGWKDYKLGVPQRTSCKEQQTSFLSSGVTVVSRITKNELGFRVTPASNAEHASLYALFLGCSFMEGAGLRDDETLPNQFALKVPRTKVVNLAASGFGLQQALLELERPELLQGASPSRAIGVYGFGEWQLSRLSGAPLAACLWGRNFPLMAKSGRGEIVQIGRLADRCPVPPLFGEFLNKSRLAYFIFSRLEEPLPSIYYLDLAASLLLATRNTFERRFNSREFYVMLYPGSSQVVDGLKQRLETLGVKVLDYSHNLNYQVLPDGHPTARTNQILAETLAHDLGVEPLRSKPTIGKFKRP